MNRSSFEKEVNKNYLKVIAQEIDYSKIIVIDIETTGTYRFVEDITSFQIEYTEKETQELKREFIEWSDFEVSLWAKFLMSLKNNKAKIVGYNLKFDTLFLHEKTGVLLKAFGDPFVMAHVLSEPKLGLKELVIKYFRDNYDIDTKNKTGEVTAKLIEYGLKDVMYTHKLYDMFKKDLKDNDLVNVYREELRVYNAYITVESQKGIYLDPDRDKAVEYLKSQYEPIKDRLDEVARINWGSPQQVANVLFSSIDTQIVSKPKKVTTWTIEETGEQFKTKIEATKHLKEQGLKPSQYTIIKSVEEKQKILGYGLGLKPKKMTDSGNPSTDDTTLSELLDEHECIKDLREWKRLTKLETMIKGLEKFSTEGGYIHPSFNITARTGRTTCKDPNLQNIPQDKNVRNIITVPKNYKLIEADLSQVELRVAAILSEDENMLNAYNSGIDLHTNTMNLMFGNRVKEADKGELKRLRTYAKACFTGNTEILTEGGFVRFKDYDGVTPVAQYNIESKEISYTKPLNFKMIPNQPVCTFENENTSLRLTPNHECIVEVKNNKKTYTKKVPFEELAGHGQTKYAFINAGYYDYDESKFIDDDLTRLISAFVADGTYNKQSMASIRFGFTKKRKIERMRELLDRLSIDYVVSDIGSAKVTTFTVNDFEIVTLVKRYCDKDKTLSKHSLVELNPYVYLEEAQYWDGSVNHTKLIQVFSTNKSTLDTMQIMAIQSGIRARLTKRVEARKNSSECWGLSYNLNKKPVSRFISSDVDTRTFHNTNNNVYCVTVPEHNIVVRHNGKVSIQGNCNFGFLYGMTAKKFIDYAKGMGLNLSTEEAEGFRTRYLNSYPKLVEWWEECKSFTRTYGYSQTLSGRKRFLPDIWRHDFKERSEAERQSINSPVQGFASDFCISAMADIVESKELDHSRFRVLGTVHDAILLEVKEEYAEELGQKVKAIMEKPSLVKDIELPIPMIADVEIVDAWGG